MVKEILEQIPAEAKIIMSLGIAASLIAISIGGPIAYYNTNYYRFFAENGYEQEVVDKGNYYSPIIWVKKANEQTLPLDIE